jgi:serine/threonine protein kinase
MPTIESPEGPFELIDKIGSGVYGSVWQATHEKWPTCAIKILPQPTDESFEDEQPLQEAVAQKICQEMSDSPHLAPLWCAFQGKKSIYLVMPLYAGPLGQLRVQGIAAGTAWMMRVAQDVLSGLSTLHGCGRIHDDLHEGNVLYVAKPADPASPAGYRFVLGDFGRSQQWDRGSGPADPALLGRDLRAVGELLRAVHGPYGMAPRIHELLGAAEREEFKGDDPAQDLILALYEALRAETR